MARLPASLRCLCISDGRGDPGRLLDLAEALLAGGVRALLLREPGMRAGDLAALCESLRPRMQAAGGLLLVHDRADICAAGLADGVHLAGHSLRPEQVRRFLPEGALVGVSVHDAAEIHAAQAADYLALARVFSTACKPGAPALGLAQAAALSREGSRPFLLLGGIHAGRIAELRTIEAFGVAVMGALCDAADPAAAARALMQALNTDES